MMKLTVCCCLSVALCLTALPSRAEDDAANVYSSTLTPTMGWSSWNTFALDINERVIRNQAAAMVQKGLAAVGYNYINIDDGFWNGRGEDGKLILNTSLFPGGMKALTNYIHKRGLKAGIYSDAGDNTCGSGNTRAYGLGVGLYGHEDEDCELYFKDWDFDFIKVDYCGGMHLNLNDSLQYTRISQAIHRQARELGKPIVFNICRWAYPGTWVDGICDSWRTTGDIYCAWESVKGIIRENLNIQAYTSRGHYNDMDMLEIGRTLSPDEEVTHMAYWCIASSPLLIGCDLTKIPVRSLQLLKNTDLIAMNQDTLGLGAPVVAVQGDVYTVAKDVEQLHGPKRAVVMMNLGDEPATAKLLLSSIEMEGNKYAPVPKAQQKRALSFLNQKVFTRPSWLVEQPYIFNLTDTPDSYLYPLINNVLSASSLLSLGRLDRMDQFAKADASNYAPEDYMADLHQMVFTELEKGSKVDSYRRYLQNRFVTTALEVVKADRSKTSPSRALVMGELMAIQKKAAKAKSSDAATAAHWQAISQQIANALD